MGHLTCESVVSLVTYWLHNTDMMKILPVSPIRQYMIIQCWIKIACRCSASKSGMTCVPTAITSKSSAFLPSSVSKLQFRSLFSKKKKKIENVSHRAVRSRKWLAFNIRWIQCIWSIPIYTVCICKWNMVPESEICFLWPHTGSADSLLSA